MNPVIETRRALERWAKKQTGTSVLSAASNLAIGLQQTRPTDPPIMRRLLAADVAKLKNAVAENQPQTAGE